MTFGDNGESSTPRQQAGTLTDLLDEIDGFLRRYLVLREEEFHTVALWVVHTHAIEAAQHTPYLAITSPGPNSGKTTVLKCLKALSANPFLAAGVTAAFLRRKVNMEKPTLLLDEYDALIENKQLSGTIRGLLNAGYERGLVWGTSVQSREGWENAEFDVFCPKAIAGIGSVPTTVATRSIPIRLQRKLPTEVTEDFNHDEDNPVVPEALRDRIAAWAEANVDKLRKVRPAMDDSIANRRRDVWKPLAAIAEMAGSPWPLRISAAAAALSDSEDRLSTGELLLRDIMRVWDPSEHRLRSSEIARRLRKLEDAPWGSYAPEWGRELEPAKLAGLLKPFGLKPQSIRFPDGSYNGYVRAAFDEPWARNLTPDRLDTLDSADGESDAGTSPEAPPLYTPPPSGGTDGSTYAF